MFWGFTLEGGLYVTCVVEDTLYLTMAALETTGGSSDAMVQVMLQTDSVPFLLCSLQKDKIPQQSLHLVFNPGQTLTFFLEGSGSVYLTGFVYGNHDVTSWCGGDVTDSCGGDEHQPLEWSGQHSSEDYELFQESPEDGLDQSCEDSEEDEDSQEDTDSEDGGDSEDDEDSEEDEDFVAFCEEEGIWGYLENSNGEDTEAIEETDSLFCRVLDDLFPILLGIVFYIPGKLSSFITQIWKRKTHTETLTKAPVKKAQAKKFPSKKDPVRKVPMKKKPVQKDSAKKESIKKRPLKKEILKVKKDPAKKKTQELVKRERVKKEPKQLVTKNSVKKEPVKKTPVKKEPVIKRSMMRTPMTMSKATPKSMSNITSKTRCNITSKSTPMRTTPMTTPTQEKSTFSGRYLKPKNIILCRYRMATPKS